LGNAENANAATQPHFDVNFMDPLLARKVATSDQKTAVKHLRCAIRQTLPSCGRRSARPTRYGPCRPVRSTAAGLAVPVSQATIEFDISLLNRRLSQSSCPWCLERNNDLWRAGEKPGARRRRPGAQPQPKKRARCEGFSHEELFDNSNLRAVAGWRKGTVDAKCCSRRIQATHFREHECECAVCIADHWDRSTR